MIAQPDQPVNVTILLASASPRRRELITLLGLSIETAAADIDETPLDGEHAADMAIRLSHAKASAVARSFRIPNHLHCTGHTQRSSGALVAHQVPHCNHAVGASVRSAVQVSEFRIIVASDTIVSLDGQPLGKPRDADDARSMLTQLRNRTHQVYTAITLIDTRTYESITDLACSDVPMRDYTNAEIEDYIASGDPFDKAGAYAIQHAGFHPVDRLHACFANVMGLPLCHVVRSLRRLGVEPIADVPQRCQAHIHYECPVFEKILTSNE